MGDGLFLGFLCRATEGGAATSGRGDHAVVAASGRVISRTHFSGFLG